MKTQISLSSHNTMTMVKMNTTDAGMETSGLMLLLVDLLTVSFYSMVDKSCGQRVHRLQNLPSVLFSEWPTFRLFDKMTRPHPIQVRRAHKRKTRVIESAFWVRFTASYAFNTHLKITYLIPLSQTAISFFLGVTNHVCRCLLHDQRHFPNQMTSWKAQSQFSKK